jgi:hypothetical protein
MQLPASKLVCSIHTSEAHILPAINANGMQVPTLEEYIETALAAPRTVGIYVETKHPSWHDNLGLSCLDGSNISHRVLQVCASWVSPRWWYSLFIMEGCTPCILR